MSRGDPILVVGLGRFGSAVAETLVSLDQEVLAIDRSHELVQQWASRLTHVVEVDSTNEEAMRQLGADQFSRAVVAIGDVLEASILTTALLADFGVEKIWAKAITRQHGEILRRVGATSVIYPEHQIGQRLAHVVTGGMIDFIEFEDGWSLVETTAPREMFGMTLGESGVRKKYGITVVCIKHPGQDFTYATTDSRIEEGDLFIVAGKTPRPEDFAHIH